MPLTEKDRKLVNDLLSGQSGAWEEFIDRYASLIIQVIRHTTHAHSLKLGKDDIDDLTADVFVALLERDMGAIRGFRGRSSFSTYLTVIVRRVVLRKLTQRRFLEAFGHVQAHGAGVAEATESAHRTVDAKDEVDSLMQALPQPLKDLASSVFLHGRSYREASQLLQIPMNSIGPLLARARQLLARRAT